MVRAPCCEKMGLKKGPWTAEEDQVLINYIQLHGHSNWRALPKQAGLLRCGKSCRLRWMNYLRPDIKRGNFTKEEEETIIKLHETLGNRWSAIAAKLPGRTDNEIKNVWHTHLKKKLTKQAHLSSQASVTESADSPSYTGTGSSSPQRSNTASENNSSIIQKVDDNLEGNFPGIDDNFWSEVLSADNSEVVGCGSSEVGNQLPSFEMVNEDYGSNLDENMDYWYNLFTRAGDLLELPEERIN